MINDIVAIYPGRFQPFGLHHYNTFRWTQKKFGSNNSYVVTSNKTGPKSPFNFKEKSTIIKKYGVPSNKTIQVKNPYMSQEVTKKYNDATTAVVFIVGQKDAVRLKSGKYFFAKDTTNFLYALINLSNDLLFLFFCQLRINLYSSSLVRSFSLNL